MESDPPDWHVGEKSIRDLRPAPYASRSIRLTSPRFQAALLECGTLVEELRPLDEDPFFARTGDWTIAQKEWESAEALRLERVEEVIEVRRLAIIRAKEDKTENNDKRGLMDKSTLLAKERELVVKFEAARNKRSAFESAQAELFAAQTQQTIDGAMKKNSRSLAARDQLAQDRAVAAAARNAERARKKREQEEEMKRRDKALEVARRRMQRREEVTARRGQQLLHEREEEMAGRRKAFEERRYGSIVKCEEMSAERLATLHSDTSRYSERRDRYFKTVGLNREGHAKIKREHSQQQVARLSSYGDTHSIHTHTVSMPLGQCSSDSRVE
jgi:hypothetical protein